MRDKVAISTKARENIVFAVDKMSEEEKSEMSYSKDELITECSFNNKECTVERLEVQKSTKNK